MHEVSGKRLWSASDAMQYPEQDPGFRAESPLLWHIVRLVRCWPVMVAASTEAKKRDFETQVVLMCL